MFFKNIVAIKGKPKQYVFGLFEMSNYRVGAAETLMEIFDSKEKAENYIKTIDSGSQVTYSNKKMAEYRSAKSDKVFIIDRLEVK